MYLDNTYSSRTGFRYEYTGEQLKSFAEIKLVEMCCQEKKARQSLIEFTKDPNINPNDQRLVDVKRSVEKHGALVEELSVHLHEFIRSPERKFSLSLGDVVFFGLISKDITEFVHGLVKPE